jgi:endonuclease YncB( thermonuclease family)
VSSHWKPTGSTRWLSADAYGAWSLAEKRHLWRDRKLASHHARLRPAPARFRKGYFARQRWSWAAVVMTIGFVAAWIGVPVGETPDPVASAPIEWDAAQAAPRRAADPSDAAWASRGREEGSPSTVSGRTAWVTRASFGYCYRGGGTNCVVDGDTFWIGGEKVRIADIDAPETHPPRCAYEARLGNQATEKLHALLNSGSVTMTSIDRDRDVYGRLLRNVSVNGADVGEAMVSAGVAREWVGRREPWC